MNRIMFETERLCLKKLKKSDLTTRYARWLNEAEVKKYLESRFTRHTPATLYKYWQGQERDKNCLFLGIFLKDELGNMGNIKLHRIYRRHRNAELSLMIGEKSCWGNGYAHEAIRRLLNHAFNKLKLHKVYARIYSVNKNSIKAFKRAGFLFDGIRKEHYFFGNKFVDEVCMSVISP